MIQLTIHFSSSFSQRSRLASLVSIHLSSISCSCEAILKSAYTVLGPIPSKKLGITMIHEHLLLLNKSLLLRQKAKPLDARSALLAKAPIDMEHRDALIRAPRISKINLQFDDVEIASKEVKAYLH